MKKILQKVLVRDNFKYRRLTDQEIDEDGKLIDIEESEAATAKTDSEMLARGKL